MDNYQQFFGARKETIDRLKNFYQASYFEDADLLEKRKQMYLLEMNNMAKYVDMKRGGRALDIGCGQGGLLLCLGSNWEKYGIEVSDFAREAAKKSGIITDFELQDDFFDLIIFRGTIQHIPDPITKIGESFYWLKKGGNIVFLSTPNTNSIYYKLFDTLPMLSRSLNFLLPSDLMLRQILVNFGFTVMGVKYPYLGTPYARPLKDLLGFLLKLLRIKPNIKFAFYKNMMEIYAQK